MKKHEIYDALNGIDEKFLDESENSNRITSQFRRARSHRSGMIASIFASIAIVSAAVMIGWNAHLSRIPSDQPEVITPAETADISKNIVTKITASSTLTSVPTTASATIPQTTESDTEPPSSDIIEPTASPEPITAAQPSTAIDDDHDGIPKPDLSQFTLDEWLSDSDVIWGPSDHKGIGENTIPLGTFEISDSLIDLMNRNDPNDIFAVTVDYSSCIDLDDMMNWEYNGTTWAELIEQTKSSDKQTAIDAKSQIRELQRAYKTMKLETISETFKENGLGIYTDEYALDGMFFYTFASHIHLEEFSCKSDEAFVFYPFDRIK